MSYDYSKKGKTVFILPRAELLMDLKGWTDPSLAQKNYYIGEAGVVEFEFAPYTEDHHFGIKFQDGHLWGFPPDAVRLED